MAVFCMGGTMWNGHAHVEQQHDNFDATDNEIHCARRDNGMGKSKSKSNRASERGKFRSFYEKPQGAVPVVTN
jgi:hypothetical protein